MGKAIEEVILEQKKNNASFSGDEIVLKISNDNLED
jgi:hypothetical protein